MKVFGININIPDMNVVDPKDRKFLMITGGVVLGILLVGIIPSAYQFIAVSASVKDVKSKSVIANVKIKSLPQLRKNREQYVNQITQLESQFLKMGEGPDLIGTISELAKESKVTILSSKQSEYKSKDLAANNPYYKPMLLRLELKGQYHRFGKFISLLEAHSTMIKVMEMSMERDPDEKKDLLMDLSILVFMNKSQEEAKK